MTSKFRVYLTTTSSRANKPDKYYSYMVTIQHSPMRKISGVEMKNKLLEGIKATYWEILIHAVMRREGNKLPGYARIEFAQLIL